jgi:hypothetical protein
MSKPNFSKENIIGAIIPKTQQNSYSATFFWKLKLYLYRQIKLVRYIHSPRTIVFH